MRTEPCLHVPQAGTETQASTVCVRCGQWITADREGFWLLLRVVATRLSRFQGTG